MDTKALAKSKRAHSLHHSKKHHPNPKAKVQAGSAPVGSSKKPTGKLEGEKPSQSHVSRELPSNWDRYEEDDGSGTEDSMAQVSSGQEYEVAPKSKGANFAHLIAEAKAQSLSSYSSESFNFLKNPLEDFDLGMGPLLSVKGERLLSSISDDNFLLDDKGTGSCEASFLSLNLDFLAKQLEKADLAEMLFIEPDLLSSELETMEKFPDEYSSAHSCKETTVTSDVFHFDHISEEDRNIRQCNENVSLDPSKNRFVPTPASTSIGVDDSLDKRSPLIESSQSEKMTADFYPDPATRESSRFEAAVVEAELDTLLNSFSETQIFDSSEFDTSSETEQSGHASKMPGGSSVPPHSLPMQPVKNATHFSMTATLDDDIDDLLKETSNLMKVNRAPTEAASHESGHASKMPGGSSVPPHSLPMLPVKNATHFSMTATLDDDIDDLLKETSNLMKVNRAPTEAASHEVLCVSDPDSKSKLLDEFNSWLDTI